MLYSCWVWVHYSRYWVYGLLKSTERSWEFKRSRGAGRTQSKGCVSPGKEHGWRYMASKTGLLFSFPSIYPYKSYKCGSSCAWSEITSIFLEKKGRAPRIRDNTPWQDCMAEGKPPFSHCLSDRSLQSIYDGTSMLTTSSWIKRAVPWLKEDLSVWYCTFNGPNKSWFFGSSTFLHLQPNDQQTFSKTCKSNHKFYGALFYFVFWSILLTKQHITSQLSNIPNSSFACSFWTTSPPAVLTGDTPKDVSRPNVSRALLDMACSFRGVECASGWAVGM